MAIYCRSSFFAPMIGKDVLIVIKNPETALIEKVKIISELLKNVPEFPEEAQKVIKKLTMIYVSYEGIIGFMAHELGVEVKDVAAQGCLLLSLQKVNFFLR